MEYSSRGPQAAPVAAAGMVSQAMDSMGSNHELPTLEHTLSSSSPSELGAKDALVRRNMRRRTGMSLPSLPMEDTWNRMSCALS